MAKYYAERVNRVRGPEWEIMAMGEGRKCSCEDPVLAYRLVDLLNEDEELHAGRLTSKPPGKS